MREPEAECNDPARRVPDEVCVLDALRVEDRQQVGDFGRVNRVVGGNGAGRAAMTAQVAQDGRELVAESSRCRANAERNANPP